MTCLFVSDRGKKGAVVESRQIETKESKIKTKETKETKKRGQNGGILLEGQQEPERCN